ncbi:MAG: peptidase S10 [Chlamydiia bacterium]|nr:peptidase S10 [Chlamydiia bacterium]
MRLLIALGLLAASLVAEEHEIKVNGEKLTYTSQVGKLPLKNEKGEVKGEIFYVSYLKKEEDKSTHRPVTFCFNGGPGSSSVWLHMGCFGPKKVKDALVPPYGVEDNPYTLLDVTDLVFLDPVSTGLSTIGADQDPKQFHGVDEDIQAMAEAIRLWTTENGKWDNPKYLAGESYGTTRAAGLALKLHDDEYFYLNGVILVSTVLSFQTINDQTMTNDLPYILLLPSYTAAAEYYGKLPKNLKDPVKASEKFALEVYGPALLKGDLLSESEKEGLVEKLSMFTGLSKKFLKQANLRVSVPFFAKEFLKDDQKIVGRFDFRVTGYETDATRQFFEYDPSFEMMAGPFTGAFNQYLKQELKYEFSDPYKVITDVFPWKWGTSGQGYLNVGNKLKEVMAKNPSLKVFTASGLYDLATPYYITDYTFNHLGLNPAQKLKVTSKTYPGGHMMYLDTENLKALKEDLKSFYKS